MRKRRPDSSSARWAAPLANDQVPQDALLRATIPVRQALRAAPGLDRLAQLVDALRREDVEGHVVDDVEAAGAVEPQHQFALVVLAERVLELVAVAEGLHGRHDRLHRRGPPHAPARPGGAHLVLLLAQLEL